MLEERLLPARLDDQVWPARLLGSGSTRTGFAPPRSSLINAGRAVRVAGWGPGLSLDREIRDLVKGDAVLADLAELGVAVSILTGPEGPVLRLPWM